MEDFKNISKEQLELMLDNITTCVKVMRETITDEKERYCNDTYLHLLAVQVELFEETSRRTKEGNKKGE
jgi:hypothetical protein